MTPFLQFVITIAIIIAAAKMGGYISLKLGQPSVLGELAVGIILGPSVLDMLHWAPFTDKHLGEAIAHIAELGVLLLMFIAGLDLHISDLAKSGKVSAFAGTLGVFLPLGMGYALARAFSFDDQSALFIGLILAATSVSISAQTLMEMKVLRTRVGIGLLGAAVFDDILVVLGLSIFVALSVGSGGFWGILWIAVRMFLYMGVAAVIGMTFLPKLSRKIDLLPISQGLMAFVLVVALFYAWTAEVLGGMAAITGAFLAGLIFARSPLKERIETGVSTLAYSFFVPIFFVNIGLAANARTLTGESLWLLLAMTAVAVISKVLGSGLGARMAGFSNLESLQLGAGMISRGEVGLIVASVGIAEGMINADIFAVIVGVVIITTLLTPAILRALFTKNKATV
ncbi:MAG: cation:proton antiporter [Anaerolineae bacterium]|nr:cation:proton antiporter [Anaerolineae bacterium]MBT7075438.1 cation:proton antiporter [Anaerolineae bacterium]MBT7781640.1 cation:proton antiporter [Anaerolineae bacterium]